MLHDNQKKPPTTLKQFFEETGIKETFLAQKLGITSSYLNRIKAGERRPSPDLAREISNLTGVPLESLLFPEKENAPA